MRCKFVRLSLCRPEFIKILCCAPMSMKCQCFRSLSIKQTFGIHLMPYVDLNFPLIPRQSCAVAARLREKEKKKMKDSSRSVVRTTRLGWVAPTRRTSTTVFMHSFIGRTGTSGDGCSSRRYSKVSQTRG